MNRQEFMKILARGINTLPEEEFNDAISYYNEYFDEAGEKKEKKVIKELGDPNRIAEQIMGDYKEKQESGKVETIEETKKSDRSWIWIVLICLSPILFPLAIALLAVLFAFMLVALAFVFALYVLVFALFLSGILSTGVGFATLFIHFPTGIYVMGVGLLLMALGFFFFIPVNALSRFAVRGIPVVIEAIFKRGKKHEKNI